VIGASSARLLLDVAQRDRSGQLDTVAAIVGEASADLRFNQRVLEAALQNMSQGICVVDADLRVVAWNRRYAELFNYPQGLLVVGRPVADLMQHSIAAGVIGAGDVEQRVQRRVAHMRAGTPHLSERRFPDGSVIEILGNPMPGGGYVATFSDVTAFRHAEQSLTRANETLEQRVAERTAALARAVREAERANETKSRFLAAVSHDLMQPLHAAQLFAHTLSARLGPHERITARHLDGALSATESLLGGLLDIARLDGGRLHPRARPFALDDLLGPLAAEFAALAEERGLRLDVVPTRAWIRSDPQLLRRVLQNFLSNALHHAERGRVLLGCRRHGGDLRIEVWDTGPGIAAEEQRLIFQEFRRGSGATGQGLGLGLAIAERMANLLGHALTLRSWPGRGSVFAVGVPLASAQALPAPALESLAIETSGTALIVDNEPQALAALKLLLESWGWRVLASRDGAQLPEQPLESDVAIFDYHLDGGRTGLELYTTLRNAGGDFPAIILTADRDSALRQRVQAEGLILLYKPLKPLALHQALLHLRTLAGVDA
jgi:signal transduction histidine kinase/CheY-like chemotaxis protein